LSTFVSFVLKRGKPLRVTVFGGSQPKAGETSYQEAYELGKILAEAGHTVLTGGYIGTMEAVSRGAYEAGGHVIGVTCDDIEAWRKVKANPWVKEERRFPTLEGRLTELVRGCDAAIALPGGPGTLTEVALTWNLMIVDAMPRKPLILVGTGWESVMETFFDSFEAYIPQSQCELLQFAPTVPSAMMLLKDSTTKDTK
jgi:uncharacterized protein (TIGR00730 family)